MMTPVLLIEPAMEALSGSSPLTSARILPMDSSIDQVLTNSTDLPHLT